MELFMNNVPGFLSDKNLHQELIPYMNALGITIWYCDKTKQRQQAWVTFSKRSEGQKFLDKHGEMKDPRSKTNGRSNLNGPFKPKRESAAIARLYILMTPVFVAESKRKVDRFILSHLTLEREEKARATTQESTSSAVTVSVGWIACGSNFFLAHDGTLAFVKQLALQYSGTARFSRKLLSITIGSNRLDFPYDTIEDIISSNGDNSFTLVLEEPPRVFKRVSKVDSDFTSWERTPVLDAWKTSRDLATSCLVFRMIVTDADFNGTIRTINSRDFLSITRHDLPVVQAHEHYEVNYYANTRKLELKTQTLLSSGALHFALLFQVIGLVWNNYLLPSSGLRMLEILEQFSKDSRQKRVPFPITVESMKPFFQRIPYPIPGVDPNALDVVEIVAEAIKNEQDLRESNPIRDKIYGSLPPEQHAWIFKVLVTPTRILLQGPDAENKNRVLRMFPKYNDHFLRVVFCEENGEDLGYNPRVSNAEIFARYRDVFRQGINIAGRKFLFLGFSHSSLRSHSAWFCAPFIDNNFQHQDCDTILKSLGNFKDIWNPARCAARIGQAFSETPYAVPLVECGIQVRYIEDVRSPDKSRVFSDGVGTISRGALEEIWSYLSMQNAAPTCIQIRLGGCKGMLSLDSRLTGKIICIRKESMEKFPSTDMELGICDTANKPLRLFLNRQMIKILEDMGTSPDWFFKEQNKALRILKSVTATYYNTSTFLEFQSVGVTAGLPRLIKKLGQWKIDYRRDDFLRSAVEHVVLRELRLLKHKARIPIENGVTLFGVMDETGFLEEGQVYITYDKTYKYGTVRMSRTLTDDSFVVVTRSPALHPGDIQTVKMVSPPEGHPLRDLQNCIVFSQKGSRDLPSQLSGGDLDGDLYNVIWDRGVWPKRCFEPADYPRVPPKSLGRPVTRDDIADFFVDFMRSDLLGMIATRHMIFADIKEAGTLDPECIGLAAMHSTAVDFSKTGIAVEAKEMPRLPRTRPDFLALTPPVQLYDVGQISHIADNEGFDNEDSMGLSQHKYHESEKILGKLYRSIDEKRIWEKDIHTNVSHSGPSVWDQLLGLVEARVELYDLDLDYTRKTREAWRIRNLYESFISDTMLQFSDNPRSALSEVEVFCGFILNKRGSQTRRQRDSSSKLKDEIDRIMALIVKQIRDYGSGHETESVASVNDSADGYSRVQEDVVELCWACVIVGCDNNNPEFSRLHESNLKSFRVVAACCLVRELDTLLRRCEESYGGGYLGVGSGQRREMVLPLR